MDPENQTSFATRFYSAKSQGYDYTWHDDFTKRFADYLSISPGQHVLDLACGTGLLTFLEADRVETNGRVVGVDITPSMLRLAREKKEKGGEKYAHVELYEGDILNLGSIGEVQEASFDIITVASALVLLGDPKPAIQHWIKYLKPGGIIALDAPHPRNLVSGIVLERTGRNLELPIPYYRDWVTSAYAVRQVLDAVGLEVQDVIAVENQAGYGKRYYEDSDWDDHFVEKVIMGDTARTFADPEIRRKAQAIFKEEWEKLCINGRVEEVDTVFLGIGKKPFEASEKEVLCTGGCRCGSVRYTSTSLPTNLTFCYCRACQHLSGSSYLPFGHIPNYALTFTSKSTLQTLKLSPVSSRTFCSSCGSPISMAYTFAPDGVGIVMGSIDPGSLKGEWPALKQHIFIKEKAPWTVIPDDGVKQHETSSDAHLIEPYAKAT